MQRVRGAYMGAPHAFPKEMVMHDEEREEGNGPEHSEAGGPTAHGTE